MTVSEWVATIFCHVIPSMVRHTEARVMGCKFTSGFSITRMGVA